MSFLDHIFRKGRMGRTISRAETAERLNPILEQHVWLNHYYRRAVERLDDRALAEHFAEEARTARSDVSKLNETILSAGHTPPFSGTDIDPDEIDLSDEGNYGLLYDLLDAEQELHDAIKAEDDIEHQMRTRAILGVVKTNSERRLSALKDATEGRRRPEEALHASRPSAKAEPTVEDEPPTEDDMKEERGEDELAKEMAARVEKS